MKKIIDSIGSVALLAFVIVWSFGGIVGAIYWAMEDDLVNVVLSMIIPLYGAITVLLDLIG